MSEARAAYDQDAIGSFGEFAQPHIEYGTAGHADADTVEDLGDGSDGPNGRTLIRVTLFKGRDATKRPQKGVAQGHKILCQVMAPLYAVPPKNALVLVAFPASDVETPGAGVIWGWINNSPTQQFRSSRALLDVGAEMDLVIKGKSVTLMDHGRDETPQRFACWLTVGPSPAGGAPGITCNDPTGSGFVVSGGVVGVFATDNGSPPAAKAVLNLSSSQIGLVLNGATLIKCKASGDMTIGCSKALSLVGAQVLLGAAATPISPILYGPAGLSGVPSTSVFVSP